MTAETPAGALPSWLGVRMAAVLSCGRTSGWCAAAYPRHNLKSRPIPPGQLNEAETPRERTNHLRIRV